MKKWQKRMVDMVADYLKNADKYSEGTGTSYRSIPDEVINGVKSMMSYYFELHNEKKAQKAKK